MPELLKLLQSLMWYNDAYKVFFSTHHTNNPQEYYWFVLDLESGYRKHGLYRLTTDAVLIQFLKKEYKVKELANMREYDINMIQLINTTNELEYMNWVGTAIPLEKGQPYKMV